MQQPVLYMAVSCSYIARSIQYGMESGPYARQPHMNASASRAPDEAMRRRAGRLIAQPTGYRAFHPAPLPPEPPVRMDAGLQALLSQADRALGRLDGSIQTLPNPDLFVFMYVRKDTGTVRIADGDVTVVADLPKRVEWDQDELAAMVARIDAAGADPAAYVETSYRVSERKYAAWPESIREGFTAARTVRAGRPSFRLVIGETC